MYNNQGILLPSDELLIHQTADTFGRVSQSEKSWTEKVCAMSAAKDGSVQLAFGLGKYINRNVMDGWAGISRGKEQWTVRASRELGADSETTQIGPLRYEILEMKPKRVIRFSLAENDAQPIAFEWIAESEIPPFPEEREIHLSRDGYRVNADLLRFHQTGSATGWYSIDSVKKEFSSDWVATRDRSWGVRYSVGPPEKELAPAKTPAGIALYALWFPVYCQRPDGSHYGLHFYYQNYSGPGFAHHSFQGGIEHANGKRTLFVSGKPNLRFDDRTRRILGGTFSAVDAQGVEHTYRFTPVSNTGFHLATALYGSYGGHYHGEWRGKSHCDGDYIADCTDESALPNVRHHRMALVRVEDESGGVGYGDLQTLIKGAHPDIGLTANGIDP